MTLLIELDQFGQNFYIKIRSGHKKSFEHRVYDSVDDRSLSYLVIPYNRQNEAIKLYNMQSNASVIYISPIFYVNMTQSDILHER